MRSSSVANSDKFYFLRGFPVSKSKTCGSCDHPQQRNTPPANLGEECTSLFPFPRNVGILHLVGMGVCVSLYSPSRHGRVGSLMGVSRLRGQDRLSSGLHSRRTSLFRDCLEDPQCAPGPSCRLTTNMRFPNSLNNLDVNLRPRQPQDFFPRPSNTSP